MKLPHFAIGLLVTFALTAFSLAAPPIRVALYEDAGAAGKGVPSVAEILKNNGFEVSIFKAQDVAATLEKADVVIFTGGSGSAQAKALGDTGREAVQKFVRGGGGYVGICAGAYLACSKFSWGLGLLDAQTASNRWKRGVGQVRLEFTAHGKELFGSEMQFHDVKYANGPIIKPAGRSDLAPYRPVAIFRTELAENDTPAGVMVDSPAMVEGLFGQGRVFISSPHPEQTPGLESTIERATRWAATRPTTTP